MLLCALITHKNGSPDASTKSANCEASLPRQNHFGHLASFSPRLQGAREHQEIKKTIKNFDINFVHDRIKDLPKIMNAIIEKKGNETKY